MEAQKILGVSIEKLSKSDILEKIKKFLTNPSNFYHIVSLNTENLVVAQENNEFKIALNSAQIKIIDGVGVVAAAKILKVEAGERVTGVELMNDIIKLAQIRRLRVLLLGGRPNLAVSLSNCYQRQYPEAKFLGNFGIADVKNPKENEEERIFSIVADFKPHIILAAFGSPDQELWFWRNRSRLKGIICMGVGGAFDYLGGVVPRAPVFIRKIGLEWLFRLFVQPWRWRRQMRLIKFLYLVIKSFLIGN